MMKLRNYLLFFLFFIVVAGFRLFPSGGSLSGNLGIFSTPPRFLSADPAWADSLMRSMSPEERIAQLFMVAAYSNRDSSHQKEIEKLVSEYHIGGLIFFQGGPMRQALLQNRYQSLSEIPLLIGMDAEWGLAMRLDSTISFPKQMTLGAVQNDTLIYLMGREIGRQCRRMGVHINFAPVVDINNNPDNPVINYRSFGENRFQVGKKSFLYMLGMQDELTLTAAKHFPGHGDTDTDSHLTLPEVQHNRRRLDSLELYPFKMLIERGLSGVMVAHLYVPVLESAENVATTLSKKVVTHLLKDELQFHGLVFTDALNMKGVSQFYQPGEVDVKALIAGNDILLFAEDVPLAIEMVKTAISNKEITQEEIDQRCRKILLAKRWVGLHSKKTVDTNNLLNDLNNPKAVYLNRRLHEEAITLLENKENILPIRELDTLKIAAISIGDSVNNAFHQSIDHYCEFDRFQISSRPRGGEMGRLLEQLKEYNLVLIGLHCPTQSPSKKYGITQEAVAFINELNHDKKVILTLFGSPYALKYIQGASLAEGLIVTYENNPLMHDFAGQVIFGGTKADAKLPVTASKYFPYNAGLKQDEIIRFKYTMPEEFGIPSSALNRIDSIAINGIRESAYPGCQILVAKKGKVIYYKSFGYHKYDSLRSVKNTDIYDLASVTKISSTLPVLMHLQDQGRFSLDKRLGDYLGELLDSTEYQNLVIRDILAHQAGLVPWIPFYLSTLKNKKPDPKIYRTEPSDSFPYRVANDLYILKSYRDSMFHKILSTPVRNQKKYLYSDVGYYFLQRIIEEQFGISQALVIDSLFYRPLGAETMGYSPRNRFTLDRIPPNEDDISFRKQLIHGDVHDQGAAMLNGVGGHAGVFGNANDLAIVIQMLMNYGEYGGKKYISKQTLQEFTRCQFCPTNRRGAGFDRPTMQDGPGPTCNCVSPESFGHSGYTGTLVWADPGEDIVYIFLSNRSYPIGDNPKILKMSIRTDIQQVIYDAIHQAGI